MKIYSKTTIAKPTTILPIEIVLVKPNDKYIDRVDVTIKVNESLQTLNVYRTNTYVKRATLTPTGLVVAPDDGYNSKKYLDKVMTVCSPWLDSLLTLGVGIDAKQLMLQANKSIVAAQQEAKRIKIEERTNLYNKLEIPNFVRTNGDTYKGIKLSCTSLESFVSDKYSNTVDLGLTFDDYYYGYIKIEKGSYVVSGRGIDRGRRMGSLIKALDKYIELTNELIQISKQKELDNLQKQDTRTTVLQQLQEVFGATVSMEVQNKWSSPSYGRRGYSYEICTYYITVNKNKYVISSTDVSSNVFRFAGLVDLTSDKVKEIIKIIS